MNLIIFYNKPNGFAMRSTISNGRQRGWGWAQDIAVNGIKQSIQKYQIIGRVKVESKEVDFQHEERKKETLKKQVYKRKQSEKNKEIKT